MTAEEFSRMTDDIARRGCEMMDTYGEDNPIGQCGGIMVALSSTIMRCAGTDDPAPMQSLFDTVVDWVARQDSRVRPGKTIKQVVDADAAERN